jgi:hypothetical protein
LPSCEVVYQENSGHVTGGGAWFGGIETDVV